MLGLFFKWFFMNIHGWFAYSGSYDDGVLLYSKLASCNSNVLRSFGKESTANFLKLKYELKKASFSEKPTITPKIEKAMAVVNPIPKAKPLLQEIIKQSVAVSFQKETMAMYPPQLHSTYRQRVNDFYHSCELKFQLNLLEDDDENSALTIIIQLEDLWTKIDRAWMILDHWKDHNRVMPTEESEDFKKLNGIQLVKLRDNLQSRISKREKTIDVMKEQVKASPEERGLLSLLNRKLEQLEQLKIDLETIRKILKDE
jgi:hypothetical protein